MRRWILIGTFSIAIVVLIDSSQASYDYAAGRWLQRDPLGVNPAGGVENPFQVTGQYKDGLNLYEYVSSNAIKFIDPKGTGECPPDCSPWQPYDPSGQPIPNSNDVDCGVIVKIKEISYHDKMIDVGHAWIEYPGGSMGFYPEDSCENLFYCNGMVMRPDDYAEGNLGKTWFETDKSSSRHKRLKYGAKVGMPCCRASCADVLDCMQARADNWDKRHYMLGGQNCRHFVLGVGKDCCLKFHNIHFIWF